MTSRTWRVLLVGGFLAALIGGPASIWLLAVTKFEALPHALRPDDAMLVATGREIYGEHCASCHGAALEGEPDWRKRKPNGRLPAPPHDPSGHTWHHPDAQLFELTKFGPAALVGDGYESDMPGYADVLSDREIVAVLSYIKSTWPDEIRRRHDALNAAQR